MLGLTVYVYLNIFVNLFVLFVEIHTWCIVLVVAKDLVLTVVKTLLVFNSYFEEIPMLLVLAYL